MQSLTRLILWVSRFFFVSKQVLVSEVNSGGFSSFWVFPEEMPGKAMSGFNVKAADALVEPFVFYIGIITTAGPIEKLYPSCKAI